MKKSFLRSRTFWVNVVMVIAVVAQTQFGFVVPPESQAAIIVVINLILRAITSKGLTT